jgi:GT2 family glycosyltransferase
MTGLAESKHSVSFVVITANRAEELATCLASLRGQRLAGTEIVVVDNASTDHTQRLLADQFPEARVHLSKTNLGVSGGRNVGIELARGEICICIDDDAFFPEEDAAEKVLAYFAADENLACLAMTILNSTTGTEEMKGIPRRDKQMLAEDYEATYFCGAGFAVRREMFLSAGEFWPALVYGSQEIDLGYRFLEAGHRILKSASVRVIHRSTPRARPSGQWVYFNTRDRAWVAVRHLPWRAAISTSILWWINTLWVAVRGGEIRSFLRGWVDSIRGLPAALRTRRVISSKVIDHLSRHSGRFWY